MAHQIFGDRFFARGNREAIWHDVGTQFEEARAITAEQALVEAGMTYGFTTQPLFYLNPLTNNYEQAPDQQIVLRTPTDDDPMFRPMSTVGKGYAVLQNHEIAQTLDGLGLTAKWPVDTCGSLAQGAKMFILLRETPYEIKGDAMQRFFLVSDGKDGQHGLHISVVHIRVVCANTLAAGLSNAFVDVKFNHNAQTRADFKTYARIIAQLEQAQNHVTRVFEQLAEHQVSKADAQSIIRAAFPEPGMPQKAKIFEAYKDTMLVAEGANISLEWDHVMREHEVRREHAAALRTATTECYDRLNDEFHNIAGTAWAVINAVAEVQDNRAIGRRGGADALVTSRLFGSRMNEYEAAFKAAAELVAAR